jgi:hypothetical protein
MKDKKDSDNSGTMIARLLSLLKNNPLSDRGRPKGIPLTAPDCGWNHGKPKDKKQ